MERAQPLRSYAATWSYVVNGVNWAKIAANRLFALPNPSLERTPPRREFMIERAQRRRSARGRWARLPHCQFWRDP
jgi:hypothetical protein